MAKRPDPRRLRSSLTYTVPELARVCGVTEGTVRAWLKEGLAALTTQRPTLITGDAAKAFFDRTSRPEETPHWARRTLVHVVQRAAQGIRGDG
ncbi:MerR family transcriptional regulator [Gymnodinialimonas sp.]